VAAIPGARVLFGGKALEGHRIPAVYGAIEPTAIFVPLHKLASKKYFDLCTTEVFGPVQVRRGVLRVEPEEEAAWLRAAGGSVRLHALLPPTHSTPTQPTPGCH